MANNATKKETFYFFDDPVQSRGVQTIPVKGRVLPDPVILLGKKNEWDELRIQYCTVIPDAKEKKFRMWYLGLPDGPIFEYRKSPKSVIDAYGKHRTSQLQIGYAESLNGLHWTKPNLGLVEYRGSHNNNILPFLPRYPGRPLVIEDPGTEPFPHRYKMIFSHMGGGGLAVSENGVNWNLYKKGVNLFKAGRERGEKEGFDHYILEPFAFLKDKDTKDSEKKYRLYTQASSGPPFGIRRTALLSSPDAQHWNRHPYPVMGIPDGGTGLSGQIHGLAMTLFQGYFIAFIHFCLPHPKTGWVAPRVHLALSKNGETFTIFEDEESPLIPLGPEKSWWEGGISSDSLIQTGNEFRCYFTGLPVTASWAGGVKGSDLTPHLQTGMASWELGRLLSASLKPGFSEGYLTLNLFNVQTDVQPEVVLNLEWEKGEKDIMVALLDSKTELAVDGFSFHDFQIKDKNRKEIKGRWKQGKILKKNSSVLPCLRITGKTTQVFSLTLIEKS
ncbi:MAG: hypothetical protein WDA18_00235 [Candidatus Ratteibacteria bacterium]